MNKPSRINEICKQINAEGSVLLENDGTLPLRAGDRVSVFGRMQKTYNKAGNGSGGLVHTAYTTNIFDSFAKEENININYELAEIYDKWIEDNPYDKGPDWPGPPWSQKEMDICENEVIKASLVSDKAVIIIARISGEDYDNQIKGGSYLLAEGEYSLIKKVTKYFKNVCVVLNTGNIIDMKWVRELGVGSVLYVWHGGQDGGEAVSDILCGRRFPCGKLADTICEDVYDYPQTKGFFEENEVVYDDDIFVGYRYFETFGNDKVLYPFGYGISYTDFNVENISAACDGKKVTASAIVKNTGKYPGKEVLQVYFGMDNRNRAKKELACYKKTRLLMPGESQTVKLSFDILQMKYYDEERANYVLDEGLYNIYFGTDVKSAEKILEYRVSKEVIVEKLNNLFAPNRSFKRLTNNCGKASSQEVVIGKNTNEIVESMPQNITYTGDKGIKLTDVYFKKAGIYEFLAQLDDFSLCALTQGEGMNSQKVRPGTGAAFGGVTKKLFNFGIPPVCVTDGPSGIRMDNGDIATSLPSGVSLACSWNDELVTELYELVGLEAKENDIDAILGPGINIKRSVLCGRNFEYFSEDPFLSGKMATAVCLGLKQSDVYGVIKHFAANNKENNRYISNSLVSERALREIYLKPFEMVIKSKATNMVMTGYNRINGVFCAANRDLATSVLRNEWGFCGIVMTDWWAHTALLGEAESETVRRLSVASQNDVYMVSNNVALPAGALLDDLKNGKITKNELIRCAVNICNAIMVTNTFQRFLKGEINFFETDFDKMCKIVGKKHVQPFEKINFNSQKSLSGGAEILYRSKENPLTQISVKISCSAKTKGVFSVNGSQGEILRSMIAVDFSEGENIFSLEFDDNLIEILEFSLLK